MINESISDLPNRRTQLAQSFNFERLPRHDVSRHDLKEKFANTQLTSTQCGAQQYFQNSILSSK